MLRLRREREHLPPLASNSVTRQGSSNLSQLSSLFPHQNHKFSPRIVSRDSLTDRVARRHSHTTHHEGTHCELVILGYPPMISRPRILPRSITTVRTPQRNDIYLSVHSIPSPILATFAAIHISEQEPNVPSTVRPHPRAPHR